MNLTKTSFLPALCAVACVSCAIPLHTGGDLTSSDLHYPDRSPHPERFIQLSGTVPASMQLKLIAYYLTDGRTGCRTSPSFIAGFVEGVSSSSAASVPLKLQMNGEQYSATIATDEFLPGYCDWRFGYVTAVVSKDGKTSIPNIIIRARDGWNTPYENTESGNSLDLPVNLHCDFRQLANDTPNIQSNACVSPRPQQQQYKREHFYTAATTKVVANFIDDEAGSAASAAACPSYDKPCIEKAQ